MLTFSEEYVNDVCPAKPIVKLADKVLQMLAWALLGGCQGVQDEWLLGHCWLLGCSEFLHGHC